MPMHGWDSCKSSEEPTPRTCPAGRMWGSGVLKPSHPAYSRWGNKINHLRVKRTSAYLHSAWDLRTCIQSSPLTPNGFMHYADLEHGKRFVGLMRKSSTCAFGVELFTLQAVACSCVWFLFVGGGGALAPRAALAPARGLHSNLSSDHFFYRNVANR